MLNRRFLRVKVLQQIYSLQIGYAANTDIVLSDIENTLKREVRIKGRSQAYKKIEEEELKNKKSEDNDSLDIKNENEENNIIIDSKELIDKELDSRIAGAIELFHEKCKVKNTDLSTDNENKKDVYTIEQDFSIEKIVKSAVEKHHILNKDSYDTVYADLIKVPDKVTNTYWLLIGILVLLKKICKKIPVKASIFTDKVYCQLGLLNVLSNNVEIERRIGVYVPKDNEMTLRKLYQKVFKSPIWEEFLSIKSPTKDDEVTLLNSIVRDILYKDSNSLTMVDNVDNRWEENKKSVRDILKRFFRAIDIETYIIEMPVLSYSWEEYFDFMKSLFKKTVENNEDYNKLIIPYLVNWDIDRVAKIDLIILKLAITELLNYENIPVKVTLNEYIDIAKIYSTHESPVFINGILHKISTEFIENGTIKKSGRGIIDNK